MGRLLRHKRSGRHARLGIGFQDHKPALILVKSKVGPRHTAAAKGLMGP